jgi:hypothetical protein
MRRNDCRGYCSLSTSFTARGRHDGPILDTGYVTVARRAARPAPSDGLWARGVTGDDTFMTFTARCSFHADGPDGGKPVRKARFPVLTMLSHWKPAPQVACSMTSLTAPETNLSPDDGYDSDRLFQSTARSRLYIDRRTQTSKYMSVPQISIGWTARSERTEDAGPECYA